MRAAAAFFVLSILGTSAHAADDQFGKFPSRFLGVWTPIFDDGAVCSPANAEQATTISAGKIESAPDFSCRIVRASAREGFERSDKLTAGSFVATVACETYQGQPKRQELNLAFQKVGGQEVLVISNPANKWISLFSKCK